LNQEVFYSDFMKMINAQTERSGRQGVWLDCARSDYAEMYHVQKVLHAKRQLGEIPDVAILLEHFSCITIGRSGGYHNLLADQMLLEKQGINVHETSRGGDITYHGPGQLVCYPIMALEGAQRDLHAYARKMEEVMIRTLRTFGITAKRKSDFPGVWVGEEKIGAMGIAVRKWVTMHGISLNVCPDLNHFSFIVPCGISTNGVTSMEKVLESPVDISAVRDEMRKQFTEIFQLSMRSGKLENFIKENNLETT